MYVPQRCVYPCHSTFFLIILSADILSHLLHMPHICIFLPDTMKQQQLNIKTAGQYTQSANASYVAMQLLTILIDSITKIKKELWESFGL